MSKKHLSPVFLVTVAIAASLESSLSASGEVPSQSQQVLGVASIKASQLLSSNLHVKGETFIGQTAPATPNGNGNAVDNNQPDGQPANPNNTEQPAEPRVLISEVVVKSAVGQLPSEIETQVYQVIRTKAGQTTTRSQLQEDINGIFAIGFLLMYKQFQKIHHQVLE